MIRSPLILTTIAIAAALASGTAGAQPRLEPENTFKTVEPITDPAQVAQWLQRLAGRFRYDGMLQLGDCVSMPNEEGVGGGPTELCQGIKGRSDCIAVGEGPGAQCILNVTWQDVYTVDFESGTVKAEGVSYLDPAMELYGVNPTRLAVNRMIVNNKGIAESGPGQIHGDTATFRTPCANDDRIGCQRIVRIEARPDANVIWMRFSTSVEPEPEDTYVVMTLRRLAPEQAASMDKRLNDVTSADESAEEIANLAEDVREERKVLGLDPSVNAAPVAHASEKQPLLDVLDEVVAESEQERQRQAQSPRRIGNPDVITVTRNSTSTGSSSIRMRLQPYIPLKEIRLRASDSRRLADGANPHLRLEQDRLTTDNGSRIRSVTLEINAGSDEADGLPAVIPFNATTSLVNIDYVRLRDSGQPQMTSLRNVMEPESRRCSSSLALGDGDQDFRNPYVLMGNRFADCNSTARGREGDLLFAEAVPQRLREELRDFYEPVYNQFARSLGSEPGIVFVVWRPESLRNDFRLVRSLNRTSVLLLNGPSWESGITTQRREALWEEFAQEQILRRIRWQDGQDAISEAANEYLLKLARAERQQTTRRMLTAEVPEWIAACARAISLRAGAANGPRGINSYDCALVVQFVYDAVARAGSGGEDSITRIWRTLLAEAYRSRSDVVKSSAFLGSSAEAHRIVQGLLDGAVDWTAFAAELGRFGVQLRVTPGQFAPAVQVQSLTEFRD